jgi:GTP cyclohydrolase IA
MIQTTTAQQVHQNLVSLGIETPMFDYGQTMNARRQVIATAFKAIMDALNLDTNDDSLTDTPNRIATMYLDGIFSGLDYANFPKCTTVENKFNYDQMIAVDSINLQSVCEHHFVVMDGFATIAYIPKKKILGLSKFNRIVGFFAKRPQIQERLTEQIAATIKLICETDDVAVLVKATHFCVKARGVHDQTSYTVTSKLSGVFLTKPECRTEFMALATTR